MMRHLHTCLYVAALAALALLGACATAPPAPTATPALSFSRTVASDEKKFIVSIRPLAEPAPINQIHAWEITLTTPAGIAVSNAVFFIGGGMPDHGHGFPTHPVVTAANVPGTYLLEGMKFSMHGRWEIKFAIQAGPIFDIVTFNTMVALPAISP